MSAEDRFECLLAGIRQASIVARIYQERHHRCIVHALLVSHIERAEDRPEIVAGNETRRVILMDVWGVDPPMTNTAASQPLAAVTGSPGASEDNAGLIP